MERLQTLLDLITINKSLILLEKEIQKYNWDIEYPLVKVTHNDFLNVFKKYLHDLISDEEIVLWANLIECRDDIEFESPDLQEIIFFIANPEINGDVNKDLIRNLSQTILSGTKL